MSKPTDRLIFHWLKFEASFIEAGAAAFRSSRGFDWWSDPPLRKMGVASVSGQLSPKKMLLLAGAETIMPPLSKSQLWVLKTFATKGSRRVGSFR